MRNYFVFCKKELLESVRTYRLFILLAVFFILGVLSPLSAKFLPELVSSMMQDGIQITLPDPSASDSWVQFFKNIPQLGMVVLVILLSGILSAEFSKGTLILVLTKGLSRNAVLLSKFTCTALLWTAGLLLSFGLTWGYTVYLFPGESSVHLIFSVFCLWVFGLLLLSMLLFSAVVTRANYGCLLITAVFVALLLLLNLLPGWQPYNPLTLAGSNVALLTGDASPSEFMWPLCISAAGIPVLLLLSVLLFRKKQL